MTFYLAVFLPASEGGYVVQFPDFPEAATQGETFEEAVVMAKSLLAETVEEYTKARKELPTPSVIGQAEAWGYNHRRDYGINPEAPFHAQAFEAPNVDMTPVRVSVSLAKSVLEDIDAKAAKAGYTRSGFLAAAAQAFHPQ